MGLEVNFSALRNMLKILYFFVTIPHILRMDYSKGVIRVNISLAAIPLSFSLALNGTSTCQFDNIIHFQL